MRQLKKYGVGNRIRTGVYDQARRLTTRLSLRIEVTSPWPYNEK